MAPIDFYFMAESPPCRLVEMVACLAGVKLNKRPINLIAKEHLNDEYIKLNPFHKVPFIVDGELKLTESRAICAYLVNNYMSGDDTLYPKDPVKRAEVDELLYIDCSSLKPATYRLLQGYISGPVKELDPEAEKAFREILGILDTRLESNGGKKFSLANHLTLADIALVVAFSFPEACGYDISEFVNLKAYLDRAKASIPNYKEINEVPCNNMRDYIKSVQERK